MRARTIEVAAGVVFRAGKVLITQRHQQDSLGGLWEFPGGKRREVESFVDCLRRELREELGIEVDVGELLETVVHPYPGVRVSLHFYRCRWRRHEPQLLDCQALAWVDQASLGDYEFPPADRRLLARLRDEPELWR